MFADSYDDFKVTVSVRENINGSYNSNGYINNGSNLLVNTRTDEINFNSSPIFTNNIYIMKQNDSIIAKGGETVNLTINNIYSYIEVSYYNKTYPFKSVDNAVLVAYYTDGSMGYFYDVNYLYSSNVDSATINVSFVPSKDINKIWVQYEYNPKIQLGLSITSPYVVYGTAMQPVVISVDIPSPEVGLLGGIRDSLSSGFSDMLNNLSSGFNNVVNGLSDLLSSIVELPQKIWQYIENGLKSLFVPDELYIIGYKEKWDSLLSEHLGAVYQVVAILHDSWDSLANADKTNSINLPLTTIPLLGDDTFSFGGYDVLIVPVGFEPVADTLKMIIGVVCTAMFVNGLRSKYDEFVS